MPNGCLMSPNRRKWRLKKVGATPWRSAGIIYIANPDLVERIRDNAALNEPDRSIFYGAGKKDITTILQ